MSNVATIQSYNQTVLDAHQRALTALLKLLERETAPQAIHSLAALIARFRTVKEPGKPSARGNPSAESVPAPGTHPVSSPHARNYDRSAHTGVPALNLNSTTAAAALVAAANLATDLNRSTNRKARASQDHSQSG